MTEDNTWGADEEKIIASVKAHFDWYTENCDAIVKADQQRTQDLHDAGFKNPEHSQFMSIVDDITKAQKYWHAIRSW